MVGTPRQTHYQQVHFLRKRITFADRGKTIIVGTVPAGSIIDKGLSGVTVRTVFNDGTNKQVTIGTVDTANVASAAALGNNLSLATADKVPLNVAANLYMVTDTDITVTMDLTGTTGTTGEAFVVIAFTPNIDG